MNDKPAIITEQELRKIMTRCSSAFPDRENLLLIVLRWAGNAKELVQQIDVEPRTADARQELSYVRFYEWADSYI